SLLTPGGPLKSMWGLNPRAHQAFVSMGFWAFVLLGPVCVACAACAFGFFTGRRWGYWLGVLVLLLNLAGDVVTTALGIEPRAAGGIPVSAFILWYLPRPNARSFFVAG